MGALAPAISAIAGIGSAVLGYAGSMASARAQQAQYNAQAKWQERQAQESRAVASRQAADKERQTRLLESRQLAVASASGGGPSDPGVVDLMADVAQQGDVAARQEQYVGMARGASLDYQAALSRMAGEAAMQAGAIRGAGSLLSGLTSFAGAFQPRAATPGPATAAVQPSYVPRPSGVAVPQTGTTAIPTTTDIDPFTQPWPSLYNPLATSAPYG